MLTTYDRVMEQYKRKVRLEAALCARVRDERDPAEVLTWTRDRKAASKTAVMLLFSLALLTSCTSAMTYDTRTCPAPLTPSACEQHLKGSK